jgi:hypothetical protein
MKIFIKIKQAGKRRLVLEKQPLEIAEIGQHPTLEQLISAIVSQQVELYNSEQIDKPIFDFINQKELNNKASTGKVGFGAIYREEKADLQKSIRIALDAFTDGIFIVFLNDKLIEKLDEKVVLDEKSVLTFVKVTLLIG